MNKWILLLFMLPMLNTCSFDVEDNKRFVATGRIIDSDGNPIANIGIQSSVSGRKLGATKTKSNGTFELVSLESYNGPLFISLNSGEHYNEHLTSISIENAASTSRTKDFYEMGDLQLHQKADLTIRATNVSGIGDTLRWSITYERSYCNYKYMNEELLENQSFCYDTHTTGRGYYGNTSTQNTYSSIIGSVSTLSYRLDDGPQTFVEIPLTNATNIYEIQY